MSKRRSNNHPNHMNPKLTARLDTATLRRTPTNKPPPDDSDKLDRAGITRLQEVVGVLLCTMLVAIGTLASQQANGTQATAKAVTKLLNYAAIHPDAIIRYIANDMYLHIHSDVAYLLEAKVRSHVGGTFFLSDRPKDASATPSPTTTPPHHNGAVHTIISIMRNVMASATEAELAALFRNARDGIPLRTVLIEMGHHSPNTNPNGQCMFSRHHQ
jgi:hypothetical protein